MAEAPARIEKFGEPPIGRIPIEVLDKIFSFLEARERQRIRGICRKWRVAFDVFQEIHLTLTNMNWTCLKDCQNISFDVAMQSFTRTLDSSDLMTKDFVSKIRILTFSGILVPYNVASVFKECVNLEYVGFESCELLHSDEKHFMDEFTDGNNIFPPKLGTFKYASPKNGEENGVLLAYLHKVLESANLRHFEFVVFTEEAMDLLTGTYVLGQCSLNLKLSRSCAGLLMDHLQTLRSLSLLGFDDGDDMWDWSGDALRVTFSELIRTWPPLVTGIDVSNCFDFPDYFPMSAFPTQMMHIMMAPILSGLKKLKMKLHKQSGIWTLLCGCIQSFGQQVVEFSCHCDEPGYLTIQCDGQVFSKCVSLRKLEIIGAADSSIFINVDSLPRSIQILRTSALLSYPQLDVNEITFDNLKNLQELDISSESFFGLQSGGVQITKDNLEYLLKSLTSLRRLKVKNAWLKNKDALNYIQNSSDLRLRMEDGVGIITVLNSFPTNLCSTTMDDPDLF